MGSLGTGTLSDAPVGRIESGAQRSSDITEPRPGFITQLSAPHPGQENGQKSRTYGRSRPANMYLQLPNFLLSVESSAGLPGRAKCNVTFISALVKYADSQYDATNQP